MPTKAAREASLAEIRSVRLITLNYCPMGCSFCSSTNFLHEAQGSVAAIARLEADECLAMIQRIVAAHPRVRTIIFQDDIFVFTKDKRILPLCEGIVAAKERGDIPQELQFISTNRIDAMTPERLSAMRRAGFRVLGFGIESFSRNVLQEFNKAQIHRHIEPMLTAARRTRHHAVSRSDPELAAMHRWTMLPRRCAKPFAGCVRAARSACIRTSFRSQALRLRATRRCCRTRSLRIGTSRARRSSGISRRRSCRSIPLVREVILQIERDFESTLERAAAARCAPAFARPLARVDSVRGAGAGEARH